MDRQAELLRYISTEITKGKGGAISPQDDLLSNGVLDSLGILQLVSFIEDRFGIQVPDEDVVYDNFYSVEKLSDYLAKQQ